MTAAGAKVKVIAPKINVKLDGGEAQAVDGQLAGSPSVIFDAVALVLSEAGAKMLAKEAAGGRFRPRRLRPTSRPIAYNPPKPQPLLKKAGVETDPRRDRLGRRPLRRLFWAQAKTRQWAREPKLRLLA